MDQMGKDMRLGLRMIRKSPGFAAAAILTLVLAIGGTTAIFSFVDPVLLKPLPFPRADHILNVWEKPPGGERNGISALNFLDSKNQNTVFTAMAAQSWGSVTLTGANVPTPVSSCGKLANPHANLIQPFVWRQPTRPLDPSVRQYCVGGGGCSGMLHSCPQSDAGGSLGGAQA